jgi:hypothetical protein
MGFVRAPFRLQGPYRGRATTKEMELEEVRETCLLGGAPSAFAICTKDRANRSTTKPSARTRWQIPLTDSRRIP